MDHDTEPTAEDDSIERRLRRALNGAENGSNTPDLILARFMAEVLPVLDSAIRARDAWYGVELAPGQSRPGRTPAELLEELRRAGAEVVDGRTWYRALSPAGSLWCETSVPVEAIGSVAGREGYSLERLPTYVVRTPWEQWNPA